ncbi:MAG: HEAT repeat domain-containing protein [Planctomycetes bacterium]|nr:HEAT repeat domain-containing protein [Planctomycetota bacterium]
MSRALLALLATLAGCVPMCDGAAVVARAKAGEVVALHELGELGDPMVPSNSRPDPTPLTAFTTLIPFLQDPDPTRRLTALEGLRRLAQRFPSMQRDSYADLFDISLADPEPEIRWRACWALGRLKCTRRGLGEATRDPVARVAERACWALGECEERRGVPRLIEALEREPLVRDAACAALEAITRAGHGRDVEAWRTWWASARKR